METFEKESRSEGSGGVNGGTNSCVQSGVGQKCPNCLRYFYKEIEVGGLRGGFFANAHGNPSWTEMERAVLAYGATERQDNVNQLNPHIRCTWNELRVGDINMHTKGTRVGHDAKSLFGR